MNPATRTTIKEAIEYRTMQDDEFDHMGAVFSKAFKFTVDGEAYKKRFKGTLEPELSTQFVAIHDGQIVAGIRADRKPMHFRDESGNTILHECGEINDVSTLPNYRRMGISRRLLDMALAQMEGKGYSLAVLQANPKYFAKDLYESAGFTTLPGTADIFFARLGNPRTCWRYYPFLSLLFPLLPRLAPLFAPQPPEHCAIVFKPHLHPKKLATRPDTTLVHVGVPGEGSHGWIDTWRAGVTDAMQYVQGIHEQYKTAALLDKAMENTLPEKMVDSLDKNKAFQAFLNEGGGKHNIMVLMRGKNGQDQVSRNEIDPDRVVGGVKYSVDIMQQGRLKIVLPMIDVAWVARDHQGTGLGTTMLVEAIAIMERFFPFIISKASSGNLPLVRALSRAGFRPAASAITMVKPLKEPTLFDKLASRVEPWVL